MAQCGCILPACLLCGLLSAGLYSQPRWVAQAQAGLQPLCFTSSFYTSTLSLFSLPGPTSFLCSRECQKRDYPSHKAECKRLRAQKAAAAAAQGGDGEASGTKAGGGGGGTGKHAADD